MSSPQECITQRYLLPATFSPSADDIKIGRGKKIVAHNAKFYKIIKTELEAYSSAGSKALKSLILVRVLKHIKEVVKGKFVKEDSKTGRWYAVEDSLARTTIAQAFRDSLHSNYRSSKQFKQRRRKQAKTTSSPSSSPSGAAQLTAVDCARLACNSQQPRRVSCVSPMEEQEETTKATVGPLEVLRNSFSDLVPSDCTPDEPLLRLRRILDESSGVISAEDNPFFRVEEEDEDDLESLDGTFSPSEIAAACNQSVSSSLFNLFDTKLEGYYSFEPTPLKEPLAYQEQVQDDAMGVLDELDVSDIKAALQV